MGHSYIEEMNPKNCSYLMPLHDHGADIAVHLVKFFLNAIILLGFEPRTTSDIYRHAPTLNTRGIVTERYVLFSISV